MKPIDVVILTDNRYTNPVERDAYIDNVLLEDQLVQDALEAAGLLVKRLSWNDATFDWNMTKYALFRTTWDYFDLCKFTQKTKKENAKRRSHCQCSNFEYDQKP